MEIPAVKTDQYSYARGGLQPRPEMVNTLSEKPKTGPHDAAAVPEEIDGNRLKDSLQTINKAMAALHTTIQFAVHEDTQQMMVQVIDQRDQRVLKEFPPHEFLDTIAKIRNMIGVFLDSKV